MAKMGKSTLFASFLLLLISAAHGAGVEEACKKTPDPKFCATLLQPSAATLSDGKPEKVGAAAMNATIAKVMAAKSFMNGKAAKSVSNKEAKAAITGCAEQVGHGEGSLKVALRELNYDGKANAPAEMGKSIPEKMIGIATKELTACEEALKKSEAAAGEHADVTKEALRAVSESVQAVSVAKALVLP